ncbi:hypothetical protein [Acanthopleuribacter pedis]|uniref:Porin n=1 Tax=Acanthopleuribacter pedis TaxID=442870 RepID=A0A8J7Q8V2_9BACT|nr:hypothetical protein [Acanthopleuribacter pedis]MBO1320040.1 hypothetical protein [Acanthopleuribacter pedis]
MFVSVRRMLGFLPLVGLFGFAMAQGGEGLDLSELQKKLHIYGYFSTRYEKVWNEPDLQDGVIREESSPGEFTFPYFSLMLQQQFSQKFKLFININGEDFDSLDIANGWGEYARNAAFNIRVGKIYRSFGLYNELLDAVPVYFGIEPPELFDGDHLLISRTTNLMVWGTFERENGTIRYSITTDDGEGDRGSDTFPIGFDLRYTFNLDSQVVGISGYTSGGDTAGDRGVGEGSPDGGVLPWMAEDAFDIIGGFWEGTFKNLTLQFEYWNARHDAVRDPNAVLTVVQNAGLLPTQLARFLLDPNGPLTLDNVRTNADFDVETWYLRAGYSHMTQRGEVTPYFQWDWYANPETIKNKTYGGDNEAGAADDGEFSKATIGVAYRPTPNTAIKVDVSSHFYTLNGEDVDYPEVRVDCSFIFGK